MLTQETKKHIDAARQILVGVVPNPMSQVEQITNALIYKFMDDMDQQAVKAGGEPSFFIGDLEKYAWTKLMSDRLGNQERINIYTEALMKFSEAKQLPPLFRDIFRQAFLPYRDPEVLGLFLKEISYFDYSHSEELGNAYEYLLSIMSSQGDAGQFRTPRHIIDFIVDVVAPSKEDTILDPACGTAGFLISAYHYIKRQNEGVDPENGKVKQLTSDERKKLVNNFQGYDIDPTMVRMSQVNMYLHKFTAPKIYNYNTLSSEERWGDKFDVILANPPFMSPKGGIKPHNKFSIQANRAEVLFVDYIMNHLKPKGRAGIIVPEGIIFQSGNAYKELRKNLVNDGLFAVVSLPAGVFNPYSGVKTSILFFDNEVARKTKDLLFVKVTSDGYDLGAQRRKIEKDDLGDAGVILKEFREYIRTDQNKETIESFISESGKGFIVSKEKIAETGDYNLSADRYRIVKSYEDSKYDFVELGEVCDIFNGSTPKRTESDYWENGTIPWFTIDDIRKQGRTIKSTQQFITQKGFNESSVKLLPKNSTLICCTASVGEYAYTEIELTTNQQFNGLVIKEEYKQKLDPKFLFWCSTKFKEELVRMSGKSTFGFVSVGTLKKFKIPLPPLEVQKEIVEQIEIKQKAIEGAKQVIENLERERRYFGQSLRKLENFISAELKDVCQIFNGYAFKANFFNEEKEGMPIIRIRDVNSGVSKTYYSGDYDKKYLVADGDLLVGMDGDFYARIWNGGEALLNQRVCRLQDFHGAVKKFVFYMLQQELDAIHENTYAVTVKHISSSQIEKIKIPLPPLEVQNQMVEEIGREEEIIQSNTKLIKIMEKKIEGVLSEI